MPDSSCSTTGVLVWCLILVGLLLMPGGGVLRVGGGGAFVVLAPLEGRQTLDGNLLVPIPPQAIEVWLPHPLPPLQCLTEALVELLLYQAKKGGGGWVRVLAGLRPQPRADPGCLLQE